MSQGLPPDASRAQDALEAQVAALTADNARLTRRAERERLARKEAEQLLQAKSTELFHALQSTLESQERLRLALWASGEGIWSWEAQGDQITIDHLVLANQEIPIARQTSEELRQVVHRDDLTAYLLAWQMVVSGSRPDIDASCRCGWNGQWRWVRLRGRPVEVDADGRALRIVGTIKDISEQREAEQSLRLMAHAFANTHDAMVVVDPQWTIIEANAALARLVGREEAHLGGARLTDWMDLPLDRIQADTIWRGESVLRGTHPIEVDVVAARVEGLEGKTHYTVVALQDARERKRAREELLRQASSDALTHLPNRTAIMRNLEQLLETGKSTGLIFIDLDGFKLVNDAIGHQAGDTVLCEVAQRLGEAIAPPSFVGRWGGDEFIVVIPDVANEEQVRDLGSTILTRCRQRVPAKGREVAVGASLGVALAPRDGHDAATLLRRADAAMYMAKAGGRNRMAFFELGLEQEVVRHAELTTQLRLDAEHDRFGFVIQSVVDRNGRIAGGELLMRWSTEQHGPVSPAEFIPLAEQTGLMPRIGNFALRHAAQTAQRLQGASLQRPAYIAVNISALQLRDDKLCDDLLALCAKMKIEPRCLDLELTESAYVHDMHGAVPLLQKLHEAGFSLSLDDFGTGYSAMSQLRDLPFNKVKIDRAFVQDSTRNVRARQLLEGIVQLCGVLDMETVAEGVETAEQYALLFDMGVDLFQGWHLGRPMEVEPWLAHFQADPRFPLP